MVANDSAGRVVAAAVVDCECATGAATAFIVILLIVILRCSVEGGERGVRVGLARREAIRKVDAEPYEVEACWWDTERDIVAVGEWMWESGGWSNTKIKLFTLSVHHCIRLCKSGIHKCNMGTETWGHQLCMRGGAAREGGRVHAHHTTPHDLANGKYCSRQWLQWMQGILGG